MHPMLPPNITPEEAARLLPALQAALAPVQGAVEGALTHDPSQPKPMGGGPGASPVPSASEVFANRPASLGKTPEPVMNLSTEEAAAILGGPLAGRVGAAAVPYIPQVVRALGSAPRMAAGPVAATAAGATAATAAAPTGTGTSQYEIMQGNWDKRRQDTLSQIAAEEAAIAEAERLSRERAPQPPARPQATANKARGANALELYNSAMAAYPGQLEQHRAALEAELAPRRAAITGYRGQLTDLDKEITEANTPIRQRYPAFGAAVPVVTSILAGLTGGKIGKYTRGNQEAVAARLRDTAARGQTELDRGRSAFAGPQGRATAAELQAAEGQGISPVTAPLRAGAGGAAAGTAEGAVANLGLAGLDAMTAIPGSPLGTQSYEQIGHLPFWMQASPEIATAGGMGGLAALVAALKRPGGGRFAKPSFGPPDVPTDQIRGMAAAARQTTAPRPKPKAKTKEKEE